MDLKVDGDPGQGNTFQENTVQHADVAAPNASTIIINTDAAHAKRIAAGYDNIRKEISKQLDERTKQAIKHYETKMPGTKDMEEKLTDGGFRPSRIQEAKRLKQFWAQEAFRTADYPVIQEDNLELYTRIVREFEVYIDPMLEDGAPLRDIMRELHEKIVAPIMEIFHRNGYSDENLRYTYDHIYGMIYYLTGKCHLNWKDYDNV